MRSVVSLAVVLLAAAATAADPAAVDPEAARYAPRDPGRYAWLRRLLVAAVLLGIAWVVLAAGWSWSQQQFYVAEQDGKTFLTTCTPDPAR